MVKGISLPLPTTPTSTETIKIPTNLPPPVKLIGFSIYDSVTDVKSDYSG